MSRTLAVVFGVLLLACLPARAVEPTAGEMRAAARWVDAHLAAAGAEASPFSFTYAGKPGRSVLATWPSASHAEPVDLDGARRRAVWAESAGGLSVECRATVDRDCPAAEWVVHFTNTGHADSALVEDVQALDLSFGPGGPGPYTLHHAEGSHERVTDFRPFASTLGPGGRVELASFGGRSSDGSLPFVNLEFPGGGGVAVGVGWTGQWRAVFERPDDGGPVRVRVGMERTHLKIPPGASVRTPAVVLVFWEGGDPTRGQNLLRRWILRHATPRAGGRPVVPPVAASPHAVIPFEGTTEANMLRAIGNVARHKVPFDTWWIDAGWFTCGKNWARYVGNPDPDPERFPRGLKPVADAAHAAGMRFLLWFEPERVMPGTWLHRNHPDWLLAPSPPMPPELMYQVNDGFHLLDLGRPDARNWAERKLSDTVGAIGVDVYRNDFNIYPSFYWRHGEPDDRQGLREVRYVTGLYDLFDTLRREHPRLVLDTCASGGRRVDFEMLRRALVLTRSDYLWDPVGQQCHTAGLARWVPVTGIGAASLDAYSTRSGLGNHFTLAADYLSDDPAVWAAIARVVDEARRLRPLYTGDFYPLTPHTTAPDAWMAWQFDRDDLGEGVVQAFRRSGCGDEARTFRLRGLDPRAEYEVNDLDRTTPLRRSGRRLMDEGLEVRLPARPAAYVSTYRKVARP